MSAVLSAADPWAAAFISLCVGLVVAYQRGWIVSVAEYRRVLAENERATDRAVEVEQRIAGYQEKRADTEAARADATAAALAKMVEQLPPALRALAESKAGAS